MPRISFDDIVNLSDVVVVLLHGGLREMEEKLSAAKIPFCSISDLELSVFDSKMSADWFRAEKDNMLKAYSLFEDALSKEVYVEVVCNRIAPHFALRRFEDLNERDTYWKLLNLTEREYLVDAGAFDGDSCRSFIKAAAGHFEAIYAYELEENNFNKLKSYADSTAVNNKIFCFLKGLSDCAKMVSINGSGEGAAVKGGEVGSTRLVSLDEDLAGQRVSIIKMDIEGSEMDALKGASHIISAQKPKMAISVYHHFSDLWNVPLLLKKYNSDYRFMLRHYSDYVWDTLCLAI